MFKDELKASREAMVKGQLENRGIKDDRVLKAMREVPREAFIPNDMLTMAYFDRPLPIYEGQTISQPYIVAYMIEALKLLEPTKARVLEVGTGSGYAAAVLSRVVSQVYTLERFPSLAQKAEGVFKKLEYENIEVRVSDGTLGWEEKGPFDGIIVTAGGPTAPTSLLNQLKVGASLIIPTGDEMTMQILKRFTRLETGGFEEKNLCAVQFVPLVGKEGWPQRLDS